MTKFNKSLLTAAVVGALALPSIASAATLGYGTARQITFAKDLIVNNDTTIYTPRTLQLAAGTTDASNIATVSAAGEEVRVKVTLTNGAKFDTTADASTLVSGFMVGTELGATTPRVLGDTGLFDANGPIVGGTSVAGSSLILGAPYYSTNGQELNFSFKSPGVGLDGAAPAYAIGLNSMQVTNLVAGLFDGSEIGAEITVQNKLGQQILAATSTIAKSVWGLTYADLAQDSSYSAYKIDVVGGGTGTAAFNRKTRFSSTGAVGGAAAVPGSNTLWSAGGVTIDIAKALEVGTGASTTTPTYINNYSAVATTPQYNVVSTSTITVKVIGNDLTSFAASTSPAAQNLFLSTSATCASSIGVNAVIAGGTATFAIPGTNAAVLAAAAPWSIGSATPGPLNLYTCFQANGAKEMVAQSLKGEVSVAYNLTTQRKDPPAGTFSLKPLEQNGSNLVFQNVNPAGNATAQSFMRVTNNNAFACPVVIDAKDDAGKHSGEVKFTLGAHESKQVNSEVLEGKATSAGVTGSFGDGTGKWYVRVTAECDNVAGSALNRHQDGVVTDLTPAKNETWLTPTTKL